MSDYLELSTAKAFLLVTVPLWTSAFSSASAAEGWGCFNLPVGQTFNPETMTDAGIERIDEQEVFECDEAARTFVKTEAAKGSARHHIAMRIDHACDSLRYHLWGPDWVDSRCGPTS